VEIVEAAAAARGVLRWLLTRVTGSDSEWRCMIGGARWPNASLDEGDSSTSVIARYDLLTSREHDSSGHCTISEDEE
jgi:hypothetical protein